MLIVSTGLVISRARVAASPADGQTREKAESKSATSPAKPVADRSVTIQGKTIDEWLAALKDKDPAVRKRAVEVLGERRLTRPPRLTRSRGCGLAVISLMFSDKDAEVRIPPRSLGTLANSRSPESEASP